jgi:hypothetical protein
LDLNLESIDEMLFVEKIKIPTPVDIAISATLKIALKVNSFPPQIGKSWVGSVPKENKACRLLFRETKSRKADLRTKSLIVADCHQDNSVKTESIMFKSTYKNQRNGNN